MAPKITISRHGLTRCPGCSAHIRAEQDLDEARCPFCALAVPAELLGGRPTNQGTASPLSRAILMASVLGLPFVGCADSSPPIDATTADVVDAATDSGSDAADIPAVEDFIAQPPYGIPMDWEEPVEDVQDTVGQDFAQPQDQVDQPAYGIPMDWEESPPDIQDAVTLDAAPPEDTLPQPPYGIPMDWTDEDAN